MESNLMNNDVVRLNMGAKSANNNLNNNMMNKSQVVATNVCAENFSMKDSMEFLGTMGCAQVNMNNLNSNKSVRQAMETFIQNPEYVQAHVDFCDALVARGYKLEEAIEKSDVFFGTLKNKNIYS